jgi:hypothetical protein
LFNADVYAHLRRAMGLVSACTKEISRSGHALANEHIASAIATMRRYNRIRTPYFQDLLTQARKQSMSPPSGPAGHDSCLPLAVCRSPRFAFLTRLQTA